VVIWPEPSVNDSLELVNVETLLTGSGGRNRNIDLDRY
jgi:hypothetical protein